MTECKNGIEVPILFPTDFCKGQKTSTRCIVNQDAITLLQLPPNSTQEEVNNAMVIAIASLINRVVSLEAEVEDLKQRVLILEA